MLDDCVWGMTTGHYMGSNRYQISICTESALEKWICGFEALGFIISLEYIYSINFKPDYNNH